jgi:L-asparaginase/Glu-tRNA(Gln) amidotransferase subunit D
MTASGWYLYRRSPNVAVSAMVTAALLLSDARFNVVTTVHVAHEAEWSWHW